MSGQYETLIRGRVVPSTQRKETQMTMTLNPDHPQNKELSRPARRLQRSFAAVRLGFTWFGVRRTLTPQQRAQAAEPFGADQQLISAGKKLLDTRHPAFRNVTGLRSRMISCWKGISLPYPEPGLRLIRQDQVEPFNQQMLELKQELAEAVAELDRQYDQLRQAAREQLGDLYNPADYPTSLSGMFDVEWDFPSIQPPDYLRQLNPQLYEQEAARVAARFEEAVALAEQAFTEELNSLVSHLVERLSGSEDGKPKVFRDSAVGNLAEFFQRFRNLNVRSSQQLDELVEQAQKLVSGVAPQELRESDQLRRQIGSQLSAVQAQLDQLLVDQPRRKVLRQSPQREG
jgi:hypothetical protein